MRLVYPEYDISFEIKENRVNVLVIENPKIMLEIVRELYKQEAGEEGRFVLSEDNKILNFAKSIYLMPNLFQLNCNDKKILTRLYQNLEELTVENFPREEIQLNGYISEYLNRVCEQLPYNLEYKSQFLPSEIFKMAAVQFVKDSENFMEDLIQYINVIIEMFPIKLIVFLNLKLYLTKNQIQQLYEFVFYHKIPIMLIEGIQFEKNSAEDIIIIDKDQCTIKI